MLAVSVFLPITGQQNEVESTTRFDDALLVDPQCPWVWRTRSPARPLSSLRSNPFDIASSPSAARHADGAD